MRMPRCFLSLRVVTVPLLAALVPMAALATPPPKIPAINQPAQAQRIPGKLIWFDLLTSNMASAQQFYGAVFGWKFADASDGQRRYSVISIGGERIGGIFQPAVAPKAGSNARWLTFASVADAEAAARQAKSGGGQVVSGPTSIPDRGTHAVLRDPQGALFAVLKSDSGDPPDDAARPGEILWADLFSSKPEEAANFYRSLLGWTNDGGPTASGRLLMNAGGYSRAGIKQLPSGAKPGWMPYVQVANVAATLKRVTSAGGKILLAPSPEIFNGQVAVIADPQGGVLGVVHWVPGNR